MIEFSRKETNALVAKLQHYFRDQLEQEIDDFDAEFLLDFFTKEIGSVYYNKALADVRSLLANYLDELNDRIYELEVALPVKP